MSHFAEFNRHATWRACEEISKFCLLKFFRERSPYWETFAINDYDMMTKSYKAFSIWLWNLSKLHKLRPGILYSGLYYVMCYSILRSDLIVMSQGNKSLIRKWEDELPITSNDWYQGTLDLWDLTEMRHLLGTCLWVASKFHQDGDNRYVSKTWTNSIGISLKYLVALEIYVLRTVHFRVFCGQQCTAHMRLACNKAYNFFSVATHRFKSVLKLKPALSSEISTNDDKNCVLPLPGNTTACGIAARPIAVSPTFSHSHQTSKQQINSSYNACTTSFHSTHKHNPSQNDNYTRTPMKQKIISVMKRKRSNHRHSQSYNSYNPRQQLKELPCLLSSTLPLNNSSKNLNKTIHPSSSPNQHIQRLSFTHS